MRKACFAAIVASVLLLLPVTSFAECQYCRRTVDTSECLQYFGGAGPDIVSECEAVRRCWDMPGGGSHCENTCLGNQCYDV